MKTKTLKRHREKSTAYYEEHDGKSKYAMKKRQQRKGIYKKDSPFIKDNK